MKRITAAVLLVLMLAQSGGATIAAPPNASTPSVTLGTMFASTLQNVQERYAGTKLAAFLAGPTSYERYQAAHAAAPVFPRNPKQLVEPSLTRVSHFVAHAPVGGSRVTTSRMLVQPLALSAAPKDPLAMTGTVLPTTGNGTRTMRMVRIARPRKVLRMTDTAICIPIIPATARGRLRTMRLTARLRERIPMGSNPLCTTMPTAAQA